MLMIKQLSNREQRSSAVIFRACSVAIPHVSSGDSVCRARSVVAVCQAALCHASCSLA